MARSTTPAPFGFTGEYRDSATGFSYLRARWYNPASGTLLGRDPFAGYTESPYSLHPYQYAYANPVSNTDPSGQFCDNLLPTYTVTPLCQLQIKLAKHSLSRMGPLASMGLDFTPIVGDVKGFMEVFTGHDLITGEPLGNWRWLGLFCLGEVRHVRKLDELGDVVKVLVVGEGQTLEYALNLASIHKDYFVLSSSYRITPKVPTMPNNSFHIPGDVDARALASYPEIKEAGPFDAIIFNNPHIEENTGPASAQLIEDFIASAKGELKEGGTIHINVTTQFWNMYPEVKKVLGTSNRTFGESEYFAPFIPRYTHGGPFRHYWEGAELSRKLKNFVFSK